MSPIRTSHLTDAEVALSISGDGSLMNRLRSRWHLNRCAGCRARRDEYVAAREQLRSSGGDALQPLEWERLAAEMTANIHLGLAAGACVSSPATQSRSRTEPHLSGLRPALVFASALFLVAVAWWANTGGAGPLLPTNLVKGSASAPPAGVLLEVRAGGIGVSENGGALTLKHPNRGDIAFSVSAQGAVRARYVDSETGQVTIHNVYAQ